MLTPLLTLLSPAGERARLSVLIFHRVLPDPDALFPEEVDAATFDVLCSWVKSMFEVLPLDEAVRLRARGALPARAAAITFDDGYRDNHDVALPILARHRLPATFFIATGYLGGGRMFNDTVIESVRHSVLEEVDLRPLGLDGLAANPRIELRTPKQRRALIDDLLRAIKYRPVDERVSLGVALADCLRCSLPNDLMMSASQVASLYRAGMQIGAHTVSHPILAGLDDDQARDEIVRGKRYLEDLLGVSVGLFAYPNGKPGSDFSDRSVALVRETGFDAAFTTAWGAARGKDDAMRLPRFTPWDRSRARFALRMAGNLART